MSNPLAVAAVTAALKDLLNDGLLNHDLSSIGSFSVTALPPDRVTTGQNESNQLNLFLYQVTPNLGWRNAALPSRDNSGAPITNAPLALDLHYMVTAYGSQDFNAEVLLGYAMHLLHETPMLKRQQLRTVLGGISPVDGTILPSPFGSMSAADLADQIELLKIAPVYLNTEDLSKLWTAMQARYRPTIAYVVSVVLIQANGSVKSAPPVLQRGAEDRGPVAVGSAPPTLTGIRPSATELLPAARLGDDLLLGGTNLSGGNISVRFENSRLSIVRELQPAAVNSARQVTVHLSSIAEDPAGMADWGIGLYMVSLRVAQPNLPAWLTNSVPIALAPRITVNPLNAAPGNVNLGVTCEPRLRPQQEAAARLIFGTSEIAPSAINTPANPLQPTTLTFVIPGVAAGDYIVRLRVDGIDSLPVVISGSPPKFTFDPQQTVKVA
jgi:hypothetical protein